MLVKKEYSIAISGNKLTSLILNHTGEIKVIYKSLDSADCDAATGLCFTFIKSFLHFTCVKSDT